MATTLFALSLVFLLGRFCDGIGEATAHRPLSSFFERRYHEWRLLTHVCHMAGAIAVALVYDRGYIDTAELICRVLALSLFLSKPAFEIGWRTAEREDPFHYKDRRGYWRFAFFSARLEAWLGRSWISTKRGIIVSEIVMVAIGIGLLVREWLLI